MNSTDTIEQFEQKLSFSADGAMQKKLVAFCKKVYTESNFDSVLEKTAHFYFSPIKRLLAEMIMRKNGQHASKCGNSPFYGTYKMIL